MATLTVTKFANPDGAGRALEVRRGLQSQHVIRVQDAAVVAWPEGAKHAQTKNVGDMTGPGAVSGAWWGMLIGLIFLMPLLGAAVGALSGALAAHLQDYGIDDRFIDQVRSQVTPGTSALFLLSSDAVPDRVVDALKGQGLDPQLISSNLSQEQEEQLQAAFGAA